MGQADFDRIGLIAAADGLSAADRVAVDLYTLACRTTHAPAIGMEATDVIEIDKQRKFDRESDVLVLSARIEPGEVGWLTSSGSSTRSQTHNDQKHHGRLLL